MNKTIAASFVVIATLGAADARAQGTVIVPGPTDAVTNVATRGANWLNIGIGARPLGMGSAAIASVEGPTALFWNPANITSNERISAFLSHMELYGNSGITMTAGAVTVPVGAGQVGIGLQQFSSGEMERTTERAPFGGDPVLGGTFNYTGLAASVHYARNVTDRFAAAVGVRYATEGIDMASSSYTGFDVSTKFRTGLYGLTIGGSVQNVGTAGQFRGPGVEREIDAPRENGQATGRDLEVALKTAEPEMPTMFRLGVQAALLGDAESMFGASDPHRVIVEAAFTDGTDGAPQPSIGAEYTFRRFAMLRAGKRFFNEEGGAWEFRDGMSFGGGIRLPLGGRRMSLDYGYVMMGELRDNQVFSFDIEF